jgi:hypothetical protein
LNYTITLNDGSVVTADGYRAATEASGALAVATSDGNALFAARTWLRCTPADAEATTANAEAIRPMTAETSSPTLGEKRKGEITMIEQFAAITDVCHRGQPMGVAGQ